MEKMSLMMFLLSFSVAFLVCGCQSDSDSHASGSGVPVEKTEEAVNLLVEVADRDITRLTLNHNQLAPGRNLTNPDGTVSNHKIKVVIHKELFIGRINFYHKDKDYEVVAGTMGEGNFIFEEFQGMNDNPLKKCPKCNGSVQRLISGGNTGSSLIATEYPVTNSPTCSRDRPCCGRKTPCDKRPCDKG